ncbi:acetate--CoA ligase [Haliangium ochraceum]|uniref:Acetate--CoA ligase n=1 Tax=Haliangium ochraceum (strain DSM 14365 / JCM 11303 / SMP-2) TaxID=502025 RepID=D0LLB8_HALO1|nr:acetate--CoA ligase [Haliangium ochraceum]ACY18614.1 acetate/CoA ligase [Haliangium ochraceum DSM 14365]
MAEQSDDLYPVPERVSAGSPSTIKDMNSYRDVVSRAATDPDGFWLGVTRERIAWASEPTLGLEGSYHEVADGPFSWFSDGTLNVTESCLDRHAREQPDKVAILWEGDEPDERRELTYRQLLDEVCRTANALRRLGLQKGERAIIYMGMVPEAAIAMLACARLGAVHSVVFGGFSAEALRDRVRDSQAEIVITQDEGRRGGRSIPLKAVCDQALVGESSVRHVLCYQRTGVEVGWEEGRDHWWHEEVAKESSECAPEIVEAEHPLFILYTSGSTGKPKGLVHTSGGYLTYVSYTHQVVFDLREDDVYACVADIGWITGHSYIVYGPLANGATTMMFESTPLYPDAGRYWDMIERYGITIFYTAPTALRTLAAADASLITRRDRSSLRVLGTVGEPIDAETWKWYRTVVGEERCTIVDTWWQTETGGMCLSPIAPATPTRPGSATLPLPGIFPLLMDEQGHRMRGPGAGRLCLEQPWPGQARTVWGDHERYVATYFSMFPGLYFTGDGCRRNGDGYHWITGRVDDVLNISGHRVGTAEIEAALVALDAVAEAAVVGYPHPIKGQGVYAWVVLQPGVEIGDELHKSLGQTCRHHIGAHARLDEVRFTPALPKTRSGKVMRRILRKLAEGALKDAPAGDRSVLGDLSTLADPGLVDTLVELSEK